MDTYLAIASVRVVREYSDKPITDEAVHHILEAGRATGSSVNKQEWKFYVARDKARLGQLSETVYAPGNVQNAQVAIGIVTTSGNRFDIGRCAQNMSSPPGTRASDPFPTGFASWRKQTGFSTSPRANS